MRKYSFLFALLAVVLIAGVAFAHQITVDPSESNGSGTILVPVYNNTTALDVGDVVVWDIDASTGDNDFYVTTTTTAQTGLVAGVVWPSAIAAASEGTIAIWGVAECDTSSTGIGEASPLCTSTTAGAGTTCTTAGAGQYAISNAAGAGSSQVSCFVNP